MAFVTLVAAGQTHTSWTMVLRVTGLTRVKSLAINITLEMYKNCHLIMANSPLSDKAMIIFNTITIQYNIQ